MNSSAQAVLAGLKKQFKTSLIGSAQAMQAQLPVIPTGILALDYVLGTGGLVATKVYELFGRESSGKSLILYNLIASTQKAGKVAVLYDAERSSDSGTTQSWMAAQGVDLDDLIYLRGTAEECLEILLSCASDDRVGLIAIDSIAWMALDAEMERSMDEKLMQSVANVLPVFLRKFTAITKSAALVIVNQTRDNVGAGQYGPSDRTPGGKAKNFAAAARLEVKGKRLAEKLSGKTVDVGLEVNFCTVKNKLATPRKADHFNLRWDAGIDHLDMLVRLALQTGVLSRSGAWYALEINGVSLKGQGFDSISAQLRERLELWAPLRELLLTKRDNSVSIPDPADAE